MLKRSIFIKRMLEDGKGEDILSFFHAKKNRPAKSDKSPKRVPDEIKREPVVSFFKFARIELTMLHIETMNNSQIKTANIKKEPAVPASLGRRCKKTIQNSIDRIYAVKNVIKENSTEYFLT